MKSQGSDVFLGRKCCFVFLASSKQREKNQRWHDTNVFRYRNLKHQPNAQPKLIRFVALKLKHFKVTIFLKNLKYKYIFKKIIIYHNKMEIISLYVNIFISKSKFLFQFRSYRIRYLICFLRYPINPCLLVYARSRYCLPDWIYLQQNRTFIKYTTEKKNT